MSNRRSFSRVKQRQIPDENIQAPTLNRSLSLKNSSCPSKRKQVYSIEVIQKRVKDEIKRFFQKCFTDMKKKQNSIDKVVLETFQQLRKYQSQKGNNDVNSFSEAIGSASCGDLNMESYDDDWSEFGSRTCSDSIDFFLEDIHTLTSCYISSVDKDLEHIFSELSKLEAELDIKYSLGVQEDMEEVLVNKLKKESPYRKIKSLFAAADAGQINTFGVSNNDQFLLTSSELGICCYNLQNFKALKKNYGLNTEGRSQIDLKLSGNSKYLMSLDSKGDINILSIPMLCVIDTIETGKEGNKQQLVSSNDPDIIIYYSTASPAEINFWSIRIRQSIYTISEDDLGGGLSCLKVAPNSRFLTVCTSNLTIGIWHIPTKCLYHEFKNVHSGQVWEVTISNDCKNVVTIAKKEIKIWNLRDKQLKSFISLNIICASLTLKVIGSCQYLAIADIEKKLKIWEIKSKTLAYTILNCYSKTNHDNIVLLKRNCTVLSAYGKNMKLIMI